MLFLEGTFDEVVVKTNPGTITISGVTSVSNFVFESAATGGTIVVSSGASLVSAVFGAGTSLQLKEGSSFEEVKVDNDVTLEYVVVTFEKNNGDAEANPQRIVLLKGSGLADDSTSLPTPPTRDGFTFAGWNTQADGNGSSFDENTAVDPSLTVYAVWLDQNNSLASVLTKDAESTSGDGTLGSPFVWTIDVSNATNVIARSDISIPASATFDLFSNSNFSDGEVTGANTIALSDGQSTPIYIKVTSESQTTALYVVNINRPGAAPDTGAIDLTAGDFGQLTGVDITMEFSIDGGVNYIDITSTTFDLTQQQRAALDADENILIRFKAIAGDNVLASEDRVVSITKAATPTDVTLNTQTGALANVGATRELSLDDGVTWIDGELTTLTAAQIEGLAAESEILIRVKVTATALESDAQVITLLAADPVATPDVGATADGITITGLSPNAYYIYNANDAGWLFGQANGSGEMVIGTGDGNNTPALAENESVVIQLISANDQAPATAHTISYLPAAPDTGAIDLTAGDFGQLTGVDITMEFSIDGGVNYIDITSTTFDLTQQQRAALDADENILIRFKAIAGDNVLASEDRVVSITKAATPTDVTLNTQTGALANVGATRELSLDDGVTWIDGELTTLTAAQIEGLAAESEILIRVKVTATALESDAQVITLLAADPVATPDVGATADGITITGLSPNAYYIYNANDAGWLFGQANGSGEMVIGTGDGNNTPALAENESVVIQLISANDQAPATAHTITRPNGE
jgi:uncharacterized repeat protein (TIGR02543 family)